MISPIGYSVNKNINFGATMSHRLLTYMSDTCEDSIEIKKACDELSKYTDNNNTLKAVEVLKTQLVNDYAVKNSKRVEALNERLAQYPKNIQIEDVAHTNDGINYVLLSDGTAIKAIKVFQPNSKPIEILEDLVSDRNNDGSLLDAAILCLFRH